MTIPMTVNTAIITRFFLSDFDRINAQLCKNIFLPSGGKHHAFLSGSTIIKVVL